ncbi:unnamed protein product, partial [Brachionus calyciflorus]
FHQGAASKNHPIIGIHSVTRMIEESRLAVLGKEKLELNISLFGSISDKNKKNKDEPMNMDEFIDIKDLDGSNNKALHENFLNTIKEFVEKF